MGERLKAIGFCAILPGFINHDTRATGRGATLPNTQHLSTPPRLTRRWRGRSPSLLAGLVCLLLMNLPALAGAMPLPTPGVGPHNALAPVSGPNATPRPAAHQTSMPDRDQSAITHTSRGPGHLCHPMQVPVPRPVPSVSGGGRIDIFARRADLVRDGLTRFSGGVIAHRGDQQLEARQTTYQQSKNQFQANGDVRYFNNGFSITATRARMNLAHDTGDLYQTRYWLPARHGRGKARRIELENRERARLHQADYTTCPPGNTDWIMRARTLTLDRSTGQGIARDMVLHFKGVPFLYLPYLRFPITDARLSGFLFPGFGITSGTGTDLRLPYYWNIAPNRDATLTPRIMSRRGLMLESQFRYRNRYNHGEIQLNYLPHDALTGRKRMLFSWQHQGAPTAGWSTNINYHYVSDAHYFNDLGSNLNTTNTVYLERRADLSYNSADWSLLTRMQGFQTLSGPRPYARLPQITLNYLRPQPDNQLHYLLSAEAVRFTRAGLGPVGTRFDLQPGVSLPLRANYGFLEPRLILRHTQYWLAHTQPGQRDVLTRDLPLFSIDSGLYFERDTHLGTTPMRQTLEPRLYYLYVPYRNQSALPVFDTALYTFSFARMFRDNRFSGADRVGDANQLTAALTTRMLRRADGSEWLSASLGQTFYFSHHRVTLPGALPETRGNSALVGNLSWHPSRAWRLNANVQWDPAQRRTNSGNASIQYRSGAERIINLAYHYNRTLLENADLSFIWPLGARWHAFASWQYSLRDRLTQEQLLGVQYDSCCWGLRLLSRRYLNALDGTTSRAIYLELQLRGLSSLGDHKRIGGLLERGILGYGDTSW